MNFCTRYGYPPVPASTTTICRYIAYLSLSHKHSSTKQYLTAIRLLHIDAGLPNPLLCYRIQQVLKGLKRLKQDVPNHRPIMTTDILIKVHSLLNRCCPVDASFWAACLLAFYGMLRISSLFPPQPHALTISAARIFSWGVVVSFSYSKTIQYAERKPYIALPWNTDSRLCPASALLRAWQLSRAVKKTDPLLPCRQVSSLGSLTRSLFLAKLSAHMESLCLARHGYSGHSFRRGSATHALNCGVPAEIIKAQGDWKSLAYLDYIDSDIARTRANHIFHMM